MSYLLSECNNLTVTYHKRGTDFGYHFCVESNWINIWACETRWEFKRWLKNRGLILDKKNKHCPNFRFIKGKFREEFCWKVKELDKKVKGYKFVVMNNGDKTVGLSYTKHRIRHVMCCNPNVHERPVFDHRTTPEEIKLSLWHANTL